MALLHKNRSAPPPLADINVTPLVDIMLVLLIVFMITAPMMKQTLEINLPKTAPLKNTAPGNQVILTITRSKKIHIDKKQVSFEKLIPSVVQAMNMYGTADIIIEADASLRYGFISQIIAQLKQAGIEKISLATELLTPEK